MPLGRLGGCAFDVDHDGVAEIGVGRGHGRSKTHREILLLDEVKGSDQFHMHTFTRPNIGDWVAPHNTWPFEARGAMRESGGSSITLPADEIQLQKFSQMDTHV